MTVRLAFDVAGSGQPLLIIHGLFGSATNWRSLSRRFAENNQVFTLDMRNHGRSPWSEQMDYHAMAADLLAFLDEQGIDQANIMGHSMGGKAAMALSLSAPSRVEKLIVVDIAPVSYQHDRSDYIRYMRNIDLSQISRRSDVDAALKPHVPEVGIRAFLVQNIRQNEERRLCWRINLEALEDNMEHLVGFPDYASSFQGSSLFIHGGNSDYLLDTHKARIQDLFPNHRIHCVPGAGHWVHGENPDAVFQQASAFLDHA